MDLVWVFGLGAVSRSFVVPTVGPVMGCPGLVFANLGVAGFAFPFGKPQGKLTGFS